MKVKNLIRAILLVLLISSAAWGVGYDPYFPNSANLPAGMPVPDNKGFYEIGAYSYTWPLAGFGFGF